MERERLKQILTDYRRLVRREQRLKEIAADTLARATNTAAAPFDAIKVEVGRTSDKVGGYTAAAASLEANWRKSYDAMCAALEKLLAVIDLLGNEYQQEALTYRYVCGLTWEDIAEKMDYTPTWVYNLHKKACAELLTKEEPV